MNKTFMVVASLAVGLAGSARGQSAAPSSKVGIINLQGAVANTQDGQKAAAELQARYEPKRKELEKRQSEIQALRDQLSRGSNTMSDEAKQTLVREIDQKTKLWQRATEDAQADGQQDQDKILQAIFERMQVVIDKYARDNGYALILDISAQQSPVVYAVNSIDITNDIIALYDKNAAAQAPAAAPAANPTALPAAGKPAAPPKPVAAPPK